MSQVFSKQLWKQTLSKVIQVREWSAADAFVVLSFEGYFLSSLSIHIILKCDVRHFNLPQWKKKKSCKMFITTVLILVM